jgi:serine/threonine protein phosphatase PrpC
MKYQLAGHSALGSRPTNQDRIAHAERDQAVLLALADGLGGHTGGELAAEGLIHTALRAFERIKHTTITQPSAFLALTILQAHNAIVQYARSRPDDIQPRTTCVLCLVQNGYAYWAHVGDSRLYHFRAGKLRTRTRDHTATERLREDGVISEDEMLTHPDKSRLLKCVGGPHKPIISLGEETPLQRGDTLLLCSDGLWEAFSAEQLAGYLELGDLDESVEEMVMDAEDRRGSACDNVSAVCLRWQDSAPRSLPLQANTALNVDQDALWEIAKNRLLAQRALSNKSEPARGGSKPGRSKPRVVKKRSFRSELEELEKYIKQFE